MASITARSMPINGSVVIVAGASGSIGAATVRALQDRGANVAAAALPDAALEALARELHARQLPGLVVPTDITRRAEVDALVAQTLTVFNRIDGLVNVAGVGASPSICDMRAEDLELVIKVNLIGALHMMHAVLPAMKAQRSGAIVNVGSIAGEAGVMGAYSASKYGLRGLSDSVRREVRSWHIAVTLLEPAFVRSPMNPAMRNLRGPEYVAEAIVAALERPRRVRIMPSGYAPVVWLTKMFPAITDLVFGDARVQERMNRDSRLARSAGAGHDEAAT